MAAFISRRRSVRAEIDWLGQAGTSISAADYRKAMLAKQTERDVQREAVRHFRSAMPRGTRIWAVPNQRVISHEAGADAETRAQGRRKALTALVADGMDPGVADLHFAWDRRLGAEGNEGVAYIEFKRPVGAKPPTADQIRFIEDMRAQGKVAGVARSLEEAEDLLIEAGAPLRVLLPRQNRPASATPKKGKAPATAIASARSVVPKGGSR